MSDPIRTAAESLLGDIARGSRDNGHCLICGDYPNHPGGDDCEAEALRAALAAPVEGQALMSGFDIYDADTGEPLAGPAFDALAVRAQPTTDPSGMVLLGHWDPERDVVYGIHDDLSDVARAGLVPVYRPSGSAPLETHPEHQWVWVGGALIDAVVIHKEWQRYQQASMDRWDRDVEAQPTTDDVLWEGETARIPVAGQDGMAMDHWSAVLVPPGTRVRVVRATDQPSEDQP